MKTTRPLECGGFTPLWMDHTHTILRTPSPPSVNFSNFTLFTLRNWLIARACTLLHVNKKYFSHRDQSSAACPSLRHASAPPVNISLRNYLIPPISTTMPRLSAHSLYSVVPSSHFPSKTPAIPHIPLNPTKLSRQTPNSKFPFISSKNPNDFLNFQLFPFACSADNPVCASKPALIVHILRAESELSRRAKFYILSRMTFRPQFPCPSSVFGIWNLVIRRIPRVIRPKLSAILLFSALSTAPVLAQSVSATGPADDPTRQTDADWIDDRWSKTDMGQFLGATIETPGQRTPKAIAIKVGEHDEATICFDTDLLRYSAAWTGGFVKVHGQRYGLIAAPSPAGEIQFTTASVPGWAKDGSFADPRPQKLGALPREHAKYKGLYLHGNRVVLSYSVEGNSVIESPWFIKSGNLKIFSRSLEMDLLKSQLVRIADSPGAKASIEKIDNLSVAKLTTSEGIIAVAVVNGNLDRCELVAEEDVIDLRLPARKGTARARVFICKLGDDSAKEFATFVKSQNVEALRHLTAGAPQRWGAPLVTKGVVDRTSNSFAIDTITIPYENKWNALFFTSGHDFFSNGDAAVAAIHGDVWRVSGLDSTLEKISWKRFATGLYQPLGLKIMKDKVYVLERDQITILHDLNNDGEADFYENFNNDCIGAGGGHSYTTSLETDSYGNFYFAKCAENTPHGGTVLKVGKRGEGIAVIAEGFRNPNGLGIGPRNELTVADQQGDWVPETRLDLIKPGGFYGFVPMYKGASAPTRFDPPLVWIPRSIDNSAGGQVWVPEGKWGQFAGQMLHLSYGRCTMMLVLRDQTSNTLRQGAVVPLPGRFASGVCRGRFNPTDGHLYLSGLRGWQTAAVRDGCFQRVRYQKSFPAPIAYSATTNTFTITFSEPLDRELAEDIESYGAEMWNYRWTSNYGSPDFSVANPEKQGRDAVQIQSAKLQPDGKTVVLTIPTLRPAMQFALRYNLETTKGEPIQSALYATINAM
jgi:hypothetical protein